MTDAEFATVPIRCHTCGQQTHKTLKAIVELGGMACACGAFTTIDVADFEKEIRKSEAGIKDFGAEG